jgi:hypothetical protein
MAAYLPGSNQVGTVCPGPYNIRTSGQARELCSIIEGCRNRSLGIIAISTSQLLREVSRDQWDNLNYIYTLSVSERGIIYSGYAQTLPRFNQVFKVL